MPAASASRKLAGIEQALCFTDEFAAPFNLVVMLKIDGELPAAKLRAALDELQRRHPLLQTRILGAKSDYNFHFSSAGPIPLDMQPSLDDDWLGAAEEELHRRFDLAAGPLMRCRYLQDRCGGHLIISLHHTIVDAASLTHLLRELLCLCAGQAMDGAGKAALEGRFPSTALYPAQFAGVRMGLAVAAYMARQMADELKFRWRSRGVRKAPIVEKGRCRLLAIQFPARLTAALLEASRRERITLNAILGAGLMAAVQRNLYPSPRAPLRHITFSNLRPHLTIPIPSEALGCHMAPFRFTVMVERDGSFWPLARAIQEATGHAARSGERFLANSMMPGMMKMVLRLKAFRMGATALSYAGPLNLPDTYGTFAVTGLHAFTANFTLGPEYSALVHLFRSELWCDILYLDSDMDSDGAQRIAQDMEAILEGAACK